MSHLEKVAELAACFADSFGAAGWGRLAGLWHDLGKYSMPFQARLKAMNDSDAHIENSLKRPDHSSAGAQHVFKAFPQVGKLIAYTIAGHHAGLPDGRSNSTSCLEDRLQKAIHDISDCPPELLNALAPEPIRLQVKRESAGFQMAFFTRMLYSCLTDADFLNTEHFMQPEQTDRRQGYSSLSDIQAALIQHLTQFALGENASPVNRQRAKILSACRRAANLAPGLFSLTVPTGGGKTLSSLEFALLHALKYGLQRVIYVIPYTSIIEQTADVFGDVLEAAGLNRHDVLEHHSNFDAAEDNHRSRLAAENWDAPLIVTTSVQFFESLFHNRSSRCRRLHHIARSVVILDEAQMLPLPLLRPCLAVLDELPRNYRTSVLLCTATQPALHQRADFPFGLASIREIIPDPIQLYTSLKRVNVHKLGTLTDAAVAEKLMSSLQTLCVVNTRAHARTLYSLLEPSESHFHLSASMCPAHRSQTLATIRERLAAEEPCRVISTQLVEAGVDLDFPMVVRAAAGIDAIAQAAGRCNREGRLKGFGQLFVFMPETGLPAGAFRQNAETADMVMRRHHDFLDLNAVQDYFETLYWRKGADELDTHAILQQFEEDVRRLNFPFKTVAGLFRLIAEDMRPVIIPWNDEAERWIQTLRYAESIGGVMRRLQRYTVTVYPNDFSKLDQAGCIEYVQKHPQCAILANMNSYDKTLGLQIEKAEIRDPSSLMV